MQKDNEQTGFEEEKFTEEEELKVCLFCCEIIFFSRNLINKNN